MPLNAAIDELRRLAGLKKLDEAIEFANEPQIKEGYMDFKDYDPAEFAALRREEGLKVVPTSLYGLLVKNATGSCVGVMHNSFSAFKHGSARLLRDRSMGIRDEKEFTRSMSAYESIQEDDEQDRMDALDREQDQENEHRRLIVLAAKKCGLDLETNPVYFEGDTVELTLYEDPSGISADAISQFTSSGVGSDFRVATNDRRCIVLVFKRDY
jgi:hypothetical protein